MNIVRVPVLPLQNNVNVTIGKRCIRHSTLTNENNYRDLFSNIIKVAIINPQHKIPVKVLSHIDGFLQANDYSLLRGLPSINGIKIIGDKTQFDYGIESPETLTNLEIENLLENFM